MANSILSAVSSILTPDAIGKLATATGLDRSLAQTAIGAAVPSILSALASLVERPGGAKQLANTVSAQPSNVLTSIFGNLTASSQMADRGTSMLASLLGSGALGTLVATVARFAGIGEGSSRSLMGFLTPLIVGVLGREQRAAGLDANGLANMLTGQRKEINAAMPSGLSQLLDASRLREDIASREAPERDARQAPGYYAAITQPMRGEAATRSTWPYWVLPLLALAGVLWYLLPRESEPMATSKSASELTKGVQTKSAFLSSAPDNWNSIGSGPNDYVKKDVYSRSGEQLGTIKDVLVGPDTKMVAVIITVGHYLGIGDKEVAVPFSALQADGQRTVIDATKDSLQAAPTFVSHKASKQ